MHLVFLGNHSCCGQYLEYRDKPSSIANGYSFVNPKKTYVINNGILELVGINRVSIISDPVYEVLFLYSPLKTIHYLDKLV